MSVFFECQCGKQLQAGDEDVGKQVRCPACTSIMYLPVLTSDVTSPPAPSARQAPPTPKGETLKGFGSLPGCLFLGFLLVGILVAWENSRINDEVFKANAIPISAVVLSEEYRNNEANADIKYKGKVLEVTGKVTSIYLGATRLGVYTSNPYLKLGDLHCGMDDSRSIQTVATGHFVTVKGICQGGFDVWEGGEVEHRRAIKMAHCLVR